MDACAGCGAGRIKSKALARSQEGTALSGCRKTKLLCRLLQFQFRPSYLPNQKMQTAKVCLPTEFEQSYLSYRSYPQNLALRETKCSKSALEWYTRKLDQVEACLCLSDEKDVDVPIRDLHNGRDTV
jgi:hypothetical protein